MSPKEQYEARKAERDRRRAAANFDLTEREYLEREFHEMLDRFVTAAERIADALQRKPE